MRRILTSLVVSALLCGVTSLAQAQSVVPKDARGAAKPAATKPAVAAKPAATKPDSAAGGAEPTLIGQFGTWGAY
ncbi:MAG TPA: Invasion associated locus B family protein, partial [Bradyrhizobium sp.]|nr:Invasion associated locus B family protein [Bradyrhizobium sp.]